jgi:aerobic-type carbon monoxide dehydrogenase small subunit (CoxS/CutS family)/CO/xanthine dehydrogenase FAD-binding subunit
MLARGIRSYHRPTRLEDAFDLAARGVIPMAGGTRLLSASQEVANVLDLSGLDLDRIAVDDGDLVMGATVPLQDLIDSRPAYEVTAGLLPAACRAFSPSRMLRNMATIGGESVAASADSELAAALLALNAVYIVARRDETLDVPAIRFLKRAAEDLTGGGLVTSVLIPGAPDGAALERAAMPGSGPAIVSVALTISLTGDTCGRARIAVTGLDGPPSRVVEAEHEIEGTEMEPHKIEALVRQVRERPRYRDDTRASADYRRQAAGVLVGRALARAVAQARKEGETEVPRLRPSPSQRATLAVPYFTSGRIDVTLNGHTKRLEAEARTTLLELVRRERLWGAKHGCETGDCGACAVLLDGRPVNACLTLALRAHGRNVQTVEGIGTADKLHPVQAAFLETGAVQCGYCTPAMELCAKALLDAVPRPTEEEVRDALGGCLCRCGGYARPVRAVLDAANQR